MSTKNFFFAAAFMALTSISAANASLLKNSTDYDIPTETYEKNKAFKAVEVEQSTDINSNKSLPVNPTNAKGNGLWWNSVTNGNDADALKGKPADKHVEMAMGACVDLLSGMVHIGIGNNSPMEWCLPL